MLGWCAGSTSAGSAGQRVLKLVVSARSTGEFAVLAVADRSMQQCRLWTAPVGPVPEVRHNAAIHRTPPSTRCSARRWNWSDTVGASTNETCLESRCSKQRHPTRSWEQARTDRRQTAPSSLTSLVGSPRMISMLGTDIIRVATRSLTMTGGQSRSASPGSCIAVLPERGVDGESGRDHEGAQRLIQRPVNLHDERLTS